MSRKSSSSSIDKIEAYFTNAEHLRTLFSTMIRSDDPHRKRLLVIHGVGGIGKSSLLKMFSLQCREIRVPVARCSGDEITSAVDLLAQWASDLTNQGIKVAEFTKVLKRYQAIQLKVEEQIQKNQATRHEATGNLTKTAAQVVITSATAGIPLVGPLVKDLGSAGVNALIDWLKIFLTKPDIEILLHPLQYLTDIFLTDIAHYETKQTIVLMIDTFEQLSGVELWTADFAQRLSSNSLLIVAGRAIPEWNQSWPEWLADAYVEEVRPMTMDHMRLLVNRYYATMRGGEPNPDQVEAIIRFAQGLPLVVASAVQLWVQYGIEDFQTIKPQVVANLVDRLQEGVPPAMIPVLHAAAIVRAFNKNLLRKLVNHDIADAIYVELQRFPFVRPGSEGMMIHDRVREMIDENLRFHDPEVYRTLHQRAATHFYEQAQQLAHISGLDEEWQRLVLEQLYHLLRADELSSMDLVHSLFEQGINYTRYQFCKTLVSHLESWPIKNPRLKYRLRYYKCRLTLSEFSSAYVNREDFEALVADSDIDPDTQWLVLLHYSGFVSFTTVQYAEGAKYLRQSLQALQAIRKNSPEECQVLASVAATYPEEPYKREQLNRQAIAISETIEQPYYAYQAYIDLGHMYLNLRQFEKVEASWRSAVKIARHYQNDADLTTALNCLAEGLMAAGKFLEAEQTLNSAMHVANQIPNELGWKMYIHRHYGMLFQLMTDYNKAIQHYDESIKLYRQRRSIGGRLRTIVLLAGCYYEAGYYDDIASLVPEIDELLPKFQSHEIVSSWYAIQGHVLLRHIQHNTVDSVIDTYTKALKIALESNITILDEVMSRIFWALKRNFGSDRQNLITAILIGIAEFWRDEKRQEHHLTDIERLNRQQFVHGLAEHPLSPPLLTRIKRALQEGIPDLSPAIYLAY